jgi:hypothetical protein
MAIVRAEGDGNYSFHEDRNQNGDREPAQSSAEEGLVMGSLPLDDSELRTRRSDATAMPMGADEALAPIVYDHSQHPEMPVTVYNRNPMLGQSAVPGLSVNGAGGRMRIAEVVDATDERLIERASSTLDTSDLEVDAEDEANNDMSLPENDQVQGSRIQRAAATFIDRFNTIRNVSGVLLRGVNEDTPDIDTTLLGLPSGDVAATEQQDSEAQESKQSTPPPAKLKPYEYKVVDGSAAALAEMLYQGSFLDLSVDQTGVREPKVTNDSPEALSELVRSTLLLAAEHQGELEQPTLPTTRRRRKREPTEADQRAHDALGIAIEDETIGGILANYLHVQSAADTMAELCKITGLEMERDIIHFPDPEAPADHPRELYFARSSASDRLKQFTKGRGNSARRYHLPEAEHSIAEEATFRDTDRSLEDVARMPVSNSARGLIKRTDGHGVWVEETSAFVSNEPERRVGSLMALAALAVTPNGALELVSGHDNAMGDTTINVWAALGGESPEAEDRPYADDAGNLGKMFDPRRPIDVARHVEGLLHRIDKRGDLWNAQAQPVQYRRTRSTGAIVVSSRQLPAGSELPPLEANEND